MPFRRAGILPNFPGSGRNCSVPQSKHLCYNFTMKRNGQARTGNASLHELKRRLEEAEDALRAIRNGEIDALVVPGARGDEIFELKGAEHLYRVL